MRFRLGIVLLTWLLAYAAEPADRLVGRRFL